MNNQNNLPETPERNGYANDYQIGNQNGIPSQDGYPYHGTPNQGIPQQGTNQQGTPHQGTPPLATSSLQGSRPPRYFHDNSDSVSGHADMTPPPSSYGYGLPVGPDQQGQPKGQVQGRDKVKVDLNKVMNSSVDTLATQGTGRYLLPEDADVGTEAFSADENTERGNWSGKLDFLLSCLGYAVGLGNVWRFPYLCYRNGGGAFFIPYVIMLVFVGLPLFFMELSLGQFCSNGPLTCWQYAPLFKGIGCAQLVVSGLVAIYYNMIIAYSLFYFFSSLAKTLPWKHCDHDWNTQLCSENLPDVTCINQTIQSNGTCYSNGQFVGIHNYTLFQNTTNISRITPSEEYYNHRLLRLSSGIHDMGYPHWDLVLSLLGAWTIAFLCMIKGIKSSGKVVYFTALFPYFVLVILFFRGVTLDGAGDGIKFYITPKLERLGDAKVWNDAAVQIFFSLSNCWGGLIALASYNRFHNNCLRDTLIVTVGNCSTSIFAGFVIFSFLGFMAKELKTTVEKVAASGPGLAFIVYPDAVTRMPVSPLWAILFFLMLVTLGLDSQFAMLETVLTCLLDQFKWLRQYKTKVILAVCVFFFLLGLPLCCDGGAYMLQLMDTYCGGWGILIIGLCECISLGWIYGSDRFFNDIALMLGKRPWIWWKICWQFLSPGLILFILFFAWIDYSPARYGDDYSFPAWADALGWLMTFSSVIWIPIVAIVLICRQNGSIVERLKSLLRPTVEWGPALVKHRRLVDYVDGFVVDPWETGTKREDKQGLENYAYTISSPDIKMQMNNSQMSAGSMPYLPSTGGNLSRSMASVGSTYSVGNISYESTI